MYSAAELIAFLFTTNYSYLVKEVKYLVSHHAIVTIPKTL